MNVLLTGATGYIGSAILRRLLARGHDVVALVRSQDKASAVESLGAVARVGDAADTALLHDLAGDSDGVIHAASPGGAAQGDFDEAVVATVLAALAGSGRPYVHTDGIWTFGPGDSLDEDTKPNPTALSTWRPAVQARVRGAAGVRTVVIAPGDVYGYGRGLATLITRTPRTAGDEPALVMLGDGSQHWPVVHVDDLASLYVLALEQAPAGSLYLGTNNENPRLYDLFVAASRAAGLGGRVKAESADETRARLRPGLADALLVDQQVTSTRARDELGWRPTGPTLLAEISAGSYAPPA